MVKSAKNSARAGKAGKAAKNSALGSTQAFSAARMVQKKGAWRTFGKKNASTKAAAKPTTQAKFYPAEDVRKPLNRRFTVKAPKIRSSITPGTVLILLSGRHRGKRVVFLEAEASTGLLVVTGPYKINGVPLRKVNQAFVIATSTKVSVAGVPAVDYSIFAKQVVESAADDEAEFLNQAPAPVVLAPGFLAAQSATDAKLMAAIKKVPTLKAYLNAKYSLTNGQFPHLMKF
jgi:large subunit ribosomal protein L6e